VKLLWHVIEFLVTTDFNTFMKFWTFGQLTSKSGVKIDLRTV